VFVVLVTGPPGSGKTATLTALLDALAEDEVPHAGVDVDELSWSYPFPDVGQRCEHVLAWRNSHANAGAKLLVVAEVIESSAHLAHLLDALGADEHLIVALQADPATLRERIIEREPDGWFGLDHLLDEMERLAAEPPALGDVRLTFDTTRSSAVEIATAIRSVRSDLLIDARHAS
jgi:hypothetical protein